MDMSGLAVFAGRKSGHPAIVSLVREVFLVLLLEYGILWAADLLVILTTSVLKATAGGVPAALGNLLNIIYFICPILLGTTLKARRWSLGSAALIIGTACYLCLWGLSLFGLMSFGVQIGMASLLVLAIPFGFILGYRCGGRLQGTVFG